MHWQCKELAADIAQQRVQGFAADDESAEGGAYSAGDVFPTADRNISGISASRDTWVVTCSWDGWIRAYDVLQPPQVLEICEGSPLISVAVSPCCPRLVGVASLDSRAVLWSLSSLRLQELSGHDGPVNSLDFHPEEPARACTASDDGRAAAWDCSAGARLLELRQHGGEVCDARFLGAEAGYGSSLATACVDGLVRLWDLRAPIMRCGLLAGGEVRAVAAFAASHLLVAGTDIGTLSIWDLRTLKALREVDVEDLGCLGPVASLAFSPGGQQLAVGCAGGGAAALDFRRGVWRRAGRHGQLPSKEGAGGRCGEQEPVLSVAWAARWPWEQGPPGLAMLCTARQNSWSVLRAEEESPETDDGPAP